MALSIALARTDIGSPLKIHNRFVIPFHMVALLNSLVDVNLCVLAISIGNTIVWATPLP